MGALEESEKFGCLLSLSLSLSVFFFFLVSLGFSPPASFGETACSQFLDQVGNEPLLLSGRLIVVVSPRAHDTWRQQTSAAVAFAPAAGLCAAPAHQANATAGRGS